MPQRRLVDEIVMGVIADLVNRHVELRGIENCVALEKTSKSTSGRSDSIKASE